MAQARARAGRLGCRPGREGYLHAQFLRLKHRRGPMQAIVAVAASMLTAAYYMRRDGADYHDLGAAHSSAATTPASSPGSRAACTIWATRSPSAPPPEAAY